MFSNQYHVLEKGEYLYKKGDTNGSGFFFVVKGRVEVLVSSAQNSNNDDES